MTSAQQRPAAARAVGDGLKLHRHAVRLDGRGHTVITLRPGSTARFATNYFHHTWHVLSDVHGARLLARLIWGLAYQRVPGTLVLIDRAFLHTEPFEGNPSDPIALVPTDLTALSPAAGRDLRRFASRVGSPVGTVRWQTPGLEPAVAAVRAARDYPPGDMRIYERTRPRVRNGCLYSRDPYERGELCARVGGVVTFGGPADVLRDWAVEWHGLGRFSYGEDSSEQQWPDGEVQIWESFAARVSSARQARREVLAGSGVPGVATLDRRAERTKTRVEPAPLGCTRPGPAPAALAPADLGPLIWKAGARIGRRMAAARPPRPTAPAAPHRP